MNNKQAPERQSEELPQLAPFGAPVGDGVLELLVEEVVEEVVEVCVLNVEAPDTGLHWLDTHDEERQSLS